MSYDSVRFPNATFAHQLAIGSLHMAKVMAGSDDSLYEGDWLTIRAMRKQNGTLPAAEWLDGLQGKHQVRFQVAAKQVEVDLRDGRPSDRLEVVPQSSERLVEFRITRPGATAPHLRMLGLRDGQTLWMAHGFKKQTNQLKKTLGRQTMWQGNGLTTEGRDLNE